MFPFKSAQCQAFLVLLLRHALPRVSWGEEGGDLCGCRDAPWGGATQKCCTPTPAADAGALCFLLSSGALPKVRGPRLLTFPINEMPL